MNWIRVALVACVAALAWAALPNRTVIVDTHGATRQVIIASTLARVDDPIVVLGDSIVEGSTLPRSLCGHAIVNAGIGGASTASHLGSVLKEALAAKRAALIIVSLGTNDAAVPMSVSNTGLTIADSWPNWTRWRRVARSPRSHRRKLDCRRRKRSGPP